MQPHRDVFASVQMHLNGLFTPSTQGNIPPSEAISAVCLEELEKVSANSQYVLKPAVQLRNVGVNAVGKKKKKKL